MRAARPARADGCDREEVADEGVSAAGASALGCVPAELKICDCCSPAQWISLVDLLGQDLHLVTDVEHGEKDLGVGHGQMDAAVRFLVDVVGVEGITGVEEH